MYIEGNTVYVLLVGIFLPILVDLVTKKFADARVKSSILLVLSVASGIITEAFAAGSGYDWKVALNNAILTLVTGVASFFGLLRPLKVSGADGIIQTATPGGIGTVSDLAVARDQLQKAAVSAVVSGGGTVSVEGKNAA